MLGTKKKRLGRKKVDVGVAEEEANDLDGGGDMSDEGDDPK